jgi:hypothetical protein
MGNAGDFIKHGLLAELLVWIASNKQYLDFFDPFGGRPWQIPVEPLVAQRLARLYTCSLKQAQSGFAERYLGSAQMMRQFSGILKFPVQIYISDRDPLARQDLINSGLDEIKLEGFNANDAYSILDSRLNRQQCSLILLDPFDELPHINDKVMSKIIRQVSGSATAIVLFVLYTDQQEAEWQQFQLLNSNQQKSIRAMSLNYKAIKGSKIKGENKYHSRIILYLDKNHFSGYETLHEKLSDLAVNLSQSIQHPFQYSAWDI